MAKSGEKVLVEIGNRWGKFNLVFEQEPKTLDIIVTLRRTVQLGRRPEKTLRRSGDCALIVGICL